MIINILINYIFNWYGRINFNYDEVFTFKIYKFFTSIYAAKTYLNLIFLIINCIILVRLKERKVGSIYYTFDITLKTCIINFLSFIFLKLLFLLKINIFSKIIFGLNSMLILELIYLSTKNELFIVWLKKSIFLKFLLIIYFVLLLIFEINYFDISLYLGIILGFIIGIDFNNTYYNKLYKIKLLIMFEKLMIKYCGESSFHCKNKIINKENLKENKT